MDSIRNYRSFNGKLSYFLFEQFGAGEKEIRQFHFATQLGFLMGMLLILLEAIIWSVPLLGYFGLTGIIYVFVLLVIYFFMKKVKYLILAKELGLEFIVFFFVFHMGGIRSCGGFILMGLIPIFVSLIFRNYRWMLLVFSTFFISVSLLAIFDKHLPGKDVLTSELNLVLWALNLLAITSVVFVFALQAQQVFTDMERREVERQREINDAKTRLYTNITHEFRTPLTVILGLADAAKNNISQRDQAKMDTIIKNGKNLLQLVGQMLDLSKLESGRMAVNRIKANVIPFLKYVFQLQEFYAEGKHIVMRFSSESQFYELEFDPEKLASIVTNLLSNAIKFTPDGGQISMKVDHRGEYLCLEVEDNGVGIPLDKQESIFDRFYQVDAENTRKEGGAGIGLAITRELVQLMEGEIRVQSKPGTGTIFTVKLPYVAVTEEASLDAMAFNDAAAWEDESTPNESLQVDANAHKRLLIVEDNPDVIGYLKACYSSHFTMYVANDGKEGYQQATENIPDIIISDVMMPEMDGFELCEKLKNNYRTSHIPIILLTAKADIPSRIEGLETGADAYIVKPFNQRELLVRMQKLLELRRKLFERYSSGDEFELSSDPLVQREDQFMQHLNEIIQGNLGDEFFTIRELCREMAMSKSQLYLKFKALTNLSVAKYIRTLRLRKARELLQTTTLNVTEIAYEVGMKSLSAFSKSFKEEFGCNPSEFANRN